MDKKLEHKELGKRVQQLEAEVFKYKQAVRVLRDDLNRYKELWEEAPVAYHMLDTEGIIKQVNQTEMNMLGYTRDEMVGKSIFDFILPEQQKKAEERFRLKLAGEHIPKQHDRIYVTKGGARIYVSIDDRLQFGRDGEVLGVRTTMVDITQERRTEEALRRERDFTSAVLSTAGALVVVLNRDGQIVRFNKACERLTGYAFEEVRNRHVWDLFVIPQEVEPVKAIFRKLRSGAFPNEHENHWVARDGTQHLIMWSNTALLDHQGRVEHVVGTGIDITERRKAETALREAHAQLEKLSLDLEKRVQERTEELKRKNKQLIQAERLAALGKMANRVAHELRNPMTAIGGFARRINERTPADDPNKRYAQMIVEAVVTMERKVSEIIGTQPE